MKRAIIHIAGASMALASAPGHAALFVPDITHGRADELTIGSKSIAFDDSQRSGAWQLATGETTVAADPAFARALGRATGVVGSSSDSLDAYAHLASASLSRPMAQPAFHAAAVSKDDGLPAHLPEPASWVMMLLGFSALGFTLRRRPKVSARIRFS